METTVTETDDVVVVVSGLRKRRGEFALHDLDLRIPTGYVTGLVGPNGAGKTTLLKALLGLLKPEGGSVTLFGEHLAGAVGARDRIGVVLDRITAAPEWRAASIGSRIGRLYSRWDQQYFQQLLQRFEVPGENRVDALSRGQSVKLSLAMALAHRPDLLLLDEPSSGLDPVARRDLADVIREFMVDPGHTVLFSTHITSELDDLADHIIVLNAGEIAYTGGVDDLHERFAVARGPAPFPETARSSAIGLRLESSGRYEALIHTADTAAFGPEAVIDAASTDDVVVHFAEQVHAARTAPGPLATYRKDTTA
jgi:ABC-2 type transport system ATP-binding protein